MEFQKIPTNEKSEISSCILMHLQKLGEDLVLHWSQVYKLNVTSLRLFNVYGQGSMSGAYELFLVYF